MSTPTADEDDASEEFTEELETRAEHVLEDGDFVTFDEHNAQRD